ncbi:sulfite exporter TauE/SafE family protein [Streptomyces sp. NPDC006733]|uniref:nickel/cobalt transporter n=1 Tax=Streptomyces sp. NPDC006733 TaxID=3155460 RepID=UPI0033E0A82B
MFLLTVAPAISVLLPPADASAHPLGNFTANQYDGLTLSPGALLVEHAEDLAEIPTAQVRPDINTDGNPAWAAAELDTWARRRCATAAAGARLSVDGRTTSLTVTRAAAQVRGGQAGLATLRVDCALKAILPIDHPSMTVGYRPSPVASGPGWREITARGDRVALTASDVPATSLSRQLTSYPLDLLSSPPQQRSAILQAVSGGPPAAPLDTSALIGMPKGTAVARGVDHWTQSFTALVARHHLTWPFGLTALGFAILLGALHALTPGHGKTLIAAATNASGRTSRREAVTLGATVTLTHTGGVLALSLLVTTGSARGPEVMSWLAIASGTLVALAGATLLHHAVRQLRVHKPSHPHPHPHPHPSRSLRGVLVMGFAGGLVPSPSAVVVLVGATALGRAWFGLLLTFAYGAGLALTLTGTSLLVVRGSTRISRALTARDRPWFPRRISPALQYAAPIATATMVLVLGCGLVMKGTTSTFG